MQFKGKVMALDLGEKRIGVAISDALRIVATPYGMVERTSRKADFARYLEIIEKEAITLLVMGLPVPLNGVEGDRAKWVRHYSAELETHLSIPLVFWDEALTTVQAEQSLRQRGKRGKQIRQEVDAVAASFILQSYLDATSDRDAWLEEE